ncbi:hypothetical protein [Actinoalloteichus hymeniacidonis]|uniref:Uncharacterized protein n=1 Tax=Actinoalloteichus hymeniacidonis TaxID=340345 RepID=A0AAC9HUD2_9PSEU|nr:hypothetical protein [Actinoalloteichus hymeniacidonis]AOS65749.1 hypothetical protein TL08_24855 [Actinoalloteichus hymeniacidonis]MBB5906161.1 hypothetical protein [Actinoalloteichus hymeniacidonis]
MSIWQVASIAAGSVVVAASGGAVIGISAQKARMLAQDGGRPGSQAHNRSTAGSHTKPHTESAE